MPIYVYKNLVTNETFELEQRITEDALTKDPRSGEPVKRLIQPVGIAFKGSGFYVNDSRGSTKGGTSAGTSPAAAGSSTSESSTAAESSTWSGESRTPAATGASSTSGGAASAASPPAVG